MTRRRRPRAPGQTTADGYGADHQRARRAVLQGGPPCHACGAPATHADHVPPLDLTALGLGLTRRDAAALYTTDGTGPYQLLPACARCNLRAGAQYAAAKAALGLPRPRILPRLNRSREW